MLYRIDCFEELCREQQCWGIAKTFATDHARMNYLQKDDVMPYEQPETKVVIMSGLPGAGKDTYVRRNYTDWPVVSLDDIRVQTDERAADLTVAAV
jgi:hypothetical protein